MKLNDYTRGPSGKILAFLLLAVAPVAALWAGFEHQMEQAQTTQFCLSCHVMSEFGRSLYVDDRSYIPAVHFQNNRVPRDHACYTCHTNYTLFGGVTAKLHGVRHVYIQYFRTVPAPDRIRLYDPYNNRECLHCHLGARRFEEQKAHNRTPAMLGDIKANRLSCTASKCHDTVHDVDTLADVTFWKGADR